jgi:serine/threonine protein kinase
MAIDSYNLSADRHIGNYVIQAVLGRGCESEVYAAEERGTGAERVLKIFPLTHEITADYVVTKARVFERLSDTQATPQYFGYGEIMLGERVSMYHVYKRVHGITLKQFIAEEIQHLSPKIAFELVSAIADRLDRIHARGYAVADFESCDNIMIAGGAPVFIDFYSGMPGQPNTYYQIEVNELEKVTRLIFQRHADSREVRGIVNAITRFREKSSGKDIPFSLREWIAND